MEELSKEDLLRIIDFYKTKASQQELQYLVLQVQTGNTIKSLSDKIDSDKADHTKELENLQNHSILLVEKEKELRQKEIDSLIKKYEKTNKKINTKDQKKITGK